MDRQRSLGLADDGTNVSPNRRDVIRTINLKLASLGFAPVGDETDLAGVAFAGDLLARYKSLAGLLPDYLCPADQRIQNFLDDMLGGTADLAKIRLPRKTLVLDRHGLARELSMPIHGDHFRNDILESYRTLQGVLHNPKSDRRTTAGVFHVADAGLAVPGDKLAAPLATYGKLLEAAVNPPPELMRLPIAADGASASGPIETWCTLLLRPTVMPQTPGMRPRKTMETRFFVPGGLVCNLDFVESIFGNAGDPYLPENDAGLDIEHWTGHTGCVILAPHIVGLSKKSLGLPHASKATHKQKRDGMCYEKDDEPYNGGSAFKITLRSAAGVMVTIIGDNYFGYCKKEVKTQISFSANLSGLAEEEHAGGALASPCFSHGEYFKLDQKVIEDGHTFAKAMKLLGDRVTQRVQGYAIDRQFPDVLYVPETSEFDAKTQTVSWTTAAARDQMKMLPGKTYVLPIGYRIQYLRHPGAPSWRLVGTRAEGTVCHKPCTVSGGGKSEISKSIGDAIVYGPIYVADVRHDLDAVAEIFNRNFARRFRVAPSADQAKRASRPVLSPARSLGSVIKLLTPASEYTDEYNAWLESIPNHVRAMAFIIKRFYDATWGDDWRSHFTVDEVNGQDGHELKLNGRKLIGSYLRIGYSPEGNWRLYKLRQDFIAAAKVQFEDDITASAVVPATRLAGAPLDLTQPSVKLVENTEARLFQRPDDAIIPGFDRQTELDMSKHGLFASNYQPLTAADAAAITQNTATFEHFTSPMKQTLLDAAQKADGYVVCSAQPRLVDGKFSKNPRYLQTRPDVQRPLDPYLADIGARLYRGIAVGQPLTFPVTAVLCGRRNNPAEPGIRPLAVYNPIHYQELPELFMDFICSLTGKSPSTTGAGSEGALTKGPFNALRAASDLNNALVSYILTGLDGFSSAAGYVGPNCRVDHDVSLLIPEIWCRLRPAEQTAAYMIEHGCLERLADFTHEGKTVQASRLGWRITKKFVGQFFGRVFDNPVSVFPDEMLRPETQNLADFVDGIGNIVEAQQRVAKVYLEDGSFGDLCPPLQALITIMATGRWNGKTETDAEVRAMFTRESLLASDWYRERLERQQRVDRRRAGAQASYLDERLAAAGVNAAAAESIASKQELVRTCVAEIEQPGYVDALIGTIGVDGVAEQ